MVEATAVSLEGRISPDDSGIWSDAHAQAFKPITQFIKEQHSVPAIQLAHAGRKASTAAPWLGGRGLSPSERGWQPLAPSAIPFSETSLTPREMTIDDIEQVATQFANAAHRSLAAGFEVAELHAAHDYLLHEFLSPLSNHRTDEHDGSFENRARLTLRIAKTLREIWPAKWPVFVRLSATDWAEGGWDLDESIRLSKSLKEIGIDLIDCSSGGMVPHAKISLGPGYQVPFASAIREQAHIATGAVGLITEAQQAEQIIAQGKADAVLLARAMLRDPYGPIIAARTLGADIEWPIQYGRAK